MTFGRQGSKVISYCFTLPISGAERRSAAYRLSVPKTRNRFRCRTDHTIHDALRVDILVS